MMKLRHLLLSTALGLLPATAFAAPAAPAPPAPPASPQVHSFSWSFSTGHGRLGVQVTSMTPELRDFFGAPDDAGILVQRVESGSAAESAGLKVGDVIVEVDGDRIDEAQDVWRALEDQVEGARVPVTVVRGKKRKKLAATLTDDAPAPMTFSAPSGGSGFVMPPMPPMPTVPNTPGTVDPDLRKEIERMREQMEQMRREMRQQQGKQPPAKPKRSKRPRGAA